MKKLLMITLFLLSVGICTAHDPCVSNHESGKVKHSKKNENRYHNFCGFKMAKAKAVHRKTRHIGNWEIGLLHNIGW